MLQTVSILYINLEDTSSDSIFIYENFHHAYGYIGHGIFSEETSEARETLIGKGGKLCITEALLELHLQEEKFFR